MTNQHPIKPSQEQLQRWMFDLHFSVPHPDYGQMDAQPHWMELVERVAQWAANQELEACCEWLPSDLTIDGQDLRSVRRPEPPSEADQALAVLGRSPKVGEPTITVDVDQYDTILRALHRLKELESIND